MAAALYPIARGHCSRGYYRRLNLERDGNVVPRPRSCRWLRKVGGKLAALRLTSARRLRWRRFSTSGLRRRVANLWDDVLISKAKMNYGAVAAAAILYYSQWGFPVLVQFPSIAVDRKLRRYL